MHRHISLLLLCVALVGRLCAQSLQRQAWTTEDGLPQNSVHAVLQASDGFLWVATEGGAARFDGVRFERYTTENTPAFASNDLCCLAQTSDGSIYFGSSAGLVRWVQGRFERVTQADTPALALQLAEDRSLLLLTGDGLFSVRAQSATPLSLPSGMQATALGRGQGGEPLVAAGTTLFRHRGASWVRERALPVAPLDLFEAESVLWLRTRSEVIALSGSAELHWQLGREVPGTRIESLSATAAGVLASSNAGVYRFLWKEHAAMPLPQLEGVSVLSAFTDSEGDQWFGTDSSGLVVLRQRAIASVAALASETITAVVEGSDGTLWLGTRDSGLRMMRGGAVSTPAASARLGSQVILALAPDTRGGVWVGTPEGLDHILSAGSQAVRHITSADGLPDDLVRSLLSDGDGAVWAGTRRGLAHWDGRRVDRVLTRTEGLPSDVIGTMLRTGDGDLWIGTLAGLAHLHRGVLRVDGLQNQAVTALAQTPDGAIWAGTREGELFVRNGSGMHRIALPGLRSAITAILLDGQGRLWLRTATGLARAAIADLEACAAQATCNAAVRRYGTADGMSSTDTSFDGHPAAWRTRNGTLWFASRRGLSGVESDHLTGDTVPPPVAIEQVLLDDVPVAFADGLRIAPGQHRLAIAYAGLSLFAPGQVLYRFKLEGFDPDWTEAGNRRTAEYTNLPAGRYRFLVEARNVDGVASVAPGVLSLRVAPPFYRRWWFYALALLLVLSVAYALYWLRLRRVRREFDAVLGERNRIAREIHDTLAQDFVAVSLQLDLTSQLLRREKVTAAQEQIDTTRALVSDGIRDARESIWALRAGEAGQALPARLQAMVDAFRSAETTASFSVTGAYRALAPSIEKETLRIAKEAFGNASRHAHATTITVRLLYSEDAVTVQVSDDGAGFNLAEGEARTGHYGLRGMQERAGSIGGTLSVESAPGKGAAVTLVLPG